MTLDDVKELVEDGCYCEMGGPNDFFACGYINHGLCRPDAYEFGGLVALESEYASADGRFETVDYVDLDFISIVRPYFDSGEDFDSGEEI